MTIREIDPVTGEVLGEYEEGSAPVMGISSGEDRGEVLDGDVVEGTAAAPFDEAAFEAALRERMKAELAARATQTAPAGEATAASQKSAAEIEAETVAAALAKVNAAAAAEAAKEGPREPDAALIADKVAAAQQRAASDQAAMDAAKVNGASPAASPAASKPPAAAKGKSVAKAKPASVPVTAENLAALFDQDREKGVVFEAKDIAVPRLYLLQDMSPQVKERSPDFVQGARPGLWFNTVTMQILQSPVIVPVKFTRRYVAWRPRLDNGGGGGLVRPDVPYEEFMGYEETGINVRSYRDDKGLIEVVETPEWVALLLPNTDDVVPMPVAVSFPKTKAKVSAQMNAVISLQVIKREDGSEFTPPTFANVFRLGQKVEGEGQQSYFIPTADFLGRLTRPEIYARARKLFDQFDAGQVHVHDVGAEEQE